MIKSNIKEKFLENNLILRTLSAIVMILIAVFAINYGGIFYNLFILTIGLLSCFEWYQIVKNHPNHKKFISYGFVYIFFFCINCIYIRSLELGGGFTAMLFYTVWITDIAAYFCGIAIGGRKLLPQISPKKTWAGLIGALLCCVLLGYVFCFVYNMPAYTPILCLIIGLVAQLGDLIESFLKRYFKIKDSSNLIPGHGGILDRIDGLSAASYIFVILVFMLY